MMHSTTINVLQKIPLTTALILVSLALFYLPISADSLYFDKAMIASGELHRLISGHFMHADSSHLGWNMIGLIVLGVIIETRSKILLISSFAVGLAMVSGLLLSPLSDISVYCGLSGVLNSLLVIALYLVWVETASKWIPVTFVVCAIKIVMEIGMSQSLLSNISWPPYPEAHLAGFIGGLITVLLTKTLREQNDESFYHVSFIPDLE